jgi:seryl-tRNA synthetase
MVCRETIILDQPVPEELVADVHDKLAYANAHLERCELDRDRIRLSVDVDDAAALADAVHCVRETLDAMLRGYRTVEKELVWSQRRTPAHSGPVWRQLVEAGLVSRESDGCVALLGDACRVALALDRRFDAMARVHAAEPHVYPTLLPIGVLERCDYFASFPHHLTFAPHLVEDVDRIRHVGSADPALRSRAIGAALAGPSHVLSPSVCFHTYAALADSRVAVRRTITAVNRCYRWEAGNLATLERLWDFTMREIVFVGEPDWVDAGRARTIEQTKAFVEELALDAWIETAADPFFVGNFAAKRYFQLLRRAKLELRLALPYAGSSLAAASFNIHEDFFGRSFAIRGDHDGFVSTGCTGFGIERWVWALFAQHGPAIASWPSSTRAALEL